jgi:hypothetical protein
VSHNVLLEGVEFKNLEVLRAAVGELIREGVIDGKFEVGNVNIRGWRGSAGEGIRYGNSAWDKEMNHVCDAGIVMNGGKYDVGFKRNAEGAYVPFIESSWVSPLSVDAGAESVTGDPLKLTTTHALAGQTGDGNNVGKLSQRYALLMAERNARSKGIATRRIKAEKGVIHLQVNHR